MAEVEDRKEREAITGWFRFDIISLTLVFIKRFFISTTIWQECEMFILLLVAKLRRIQSHSSMCFHKQCCGLDNIISYGIVASNSMHRMYSNIILQSRIQIK